MLKHYRKELLDEEQDNMNSMGFPKVRLRRYRRTKAIRGLTAIAPPPISKFIWPVFVEEGSKSRRELPALPGQYVYSIDRLLVDVEPLVERGVGGILLFTVIDPILRTSNGSHAWDSEAIAQKAIIKLKKAFPELTVFADVGLSGFTTHGHNGILDEVTGSMDNDATLEAIAKVSKSLAEAGADCLAPSGMVDGQVEFIRGALDSNGMSQVLIMSYSVKFMSNLYDTFPLATDWQGTEATSNLSVMRRRDPLTSTYFAAMDNPALALRETLLDAMEGADILMVKPAQFYLDIISRVHERHLLPVAAYNVSGEYSMIHATAQRGWGELYPLAKEALMSIWRAGADIIIAYWTNQYDLIFNKKENNQ